MHKCGPECEILGVNLTLRYDVYLLFLNESMWILCLLNNVKHTCELKRIKKELATFIFFGIVNDLNSHVLSS